MERRKLYQMGGAILTLLALFALISIAFAQASSNYDLSWHVVAGGGGRMKSTDHTLMGTIGQPLTGVMWDGHTLCSGFWCGGVAVQYRIYLPLVLRNR